MKKLIWVIIFCAFSYFIYQNIFANRNNLQITTAGKNITLKNGDNKFNAEIISDYKENLRIYGINDNPSNGWSPIAYGTYILVASPFSGNTKGCEMTDAANAPFLNIIVEEKNIKNKINALKNTKGRRTAVIIGKRIAIKKFFYKNEDHSGALNPQGKLDPRNAIIVTDVITK